PPAPRCCFPAALISCRATSCRSRSCCHQRPPTAERHHWFVGARRAPTNAAGLLRGGGLVLGLGRSSRGDVFLDAGGLAFQATQEVELGAAHLAATLDGKRFD